MASQNWLLSLVLTKGTYKANRGVAFRLIHTKQIHGTLFLPDDAVHCALSFFKLTKSALDFITCVRLERCIMCGSVATTVSGPEVSPVGPVQKYLEGSFPLRNWIKSHTVFSVVMIVFPKMRLVPTSSVCLYSSFYFNRPAPLYFPHFAFSLNAWTFCMSHSLCTTSPLPVARTGSRFTCN